MSPAFPRPSNSPARSTLSYRIGTHADFLRWMLDRLPREQILDGPHEGQRPLANLATHSPRDPTVALIDAFAITADVLTFYQERIANEGFLRTAVETRSVMELGRALGFELSPGLASSAWLAFSVEQAVGAPAEVVIDPGVRVLSVPGQNQRPQTFETAERLLARPEWNELKPLSTIPQDFALDAEDLWIDPAQANLSAGDALLFVSEERETSAASDKWALRVVTDVVRYPASGHCRVTLVPVSRRSRPGRKGGRVFHMNQRAALFGHNAPAFKAMPASVQGEYGGGKDWKGFDVELTSDSRLALDNLYPKVLPATWMALSVGDKTQLCWVESIQVIGSSDFTLTARSTAPKLVTTPGPTATAATIDEGLKSGRRGLVVHVQGAELSPVGCPFMNPAWGTNILAPFPNIEVPASANPFDREDQITLDRVVLGLGVGHRLLITGKRLRAKVRSTSGIELEADSKVTTKYVQGETLFVVRRPIPIAGPGKSSWRLVDALGFEGTVDLAEGDLELTPALESDSIIAEVVTLKGIDQNPIRTTLRFAAPIRHWYDRATIAISANVALATHGETVTDVLGSGDGSQANQRFPLRRAPLTWLSAANSTGRQSALEIRVDGVLWHQVSSFHDQNANSRVYLAQHDEQGRTSIVFGDGIHGARLPSGLENVVAKYRIGLGAEGDVGQGKIMLFQTRPLGVRSVTNPLPATGGVAPDTGSRARHDIPESVVTIDRVVSLTDYETFSQTFAGFGKAKARFLSRGVVRLIHITLALADGNPVPDGAVILDYLRKALDAVRDTTTRVELAGHRQLWFRVSAKLVVAKDLLFTKVAGAAAAVMTAAFSFERRAFGQGVSASEIVALLQGVPGVESVDLDGLSIPTSLNDENIPKSIQARLEAKDADWHGADIQSAELLLLDPSPRGLTFLNPAELP